MKISVIVPVFNTEKYLRLCVESILAQTYTNIEVLLIDDRSKDASGKICDEYALKDKRVKVFHKLNGGVSSARNFGLERATGKWITFVDSDDYIEKDYLITLSKYTENSEFVIGGFKSSNGGDYTPNKNCYVESNEDLDTLLIQPYTVVVWGKLFEKSILSRIRFNEQMKVAEDFNFVLTYLSHIKKIYLVSSTNYCYTDAESNIKYRLCYDEYVKYKLYLFESLSLCKNTFNYTFDKTERYIKTYLSGRLLYNLCCLDTFSQYIAEVNRITPENDLYIDSKKKHIFVWLLTHHCSFLLYFALKFKKYLAPYK